MRRLLSFGALAIFLLALAACGEDAPVAPIAADERTVDLGTGFGKSAIELDTGALPEQALWNYEITLENLTPNNGGGASQVFSPPVMATHRRSMSMWSVGSLASAELAGIAEDAINQPMIDLLNGSRRVFQVVAGDGVIPPGASSSYEIQTHAAAQGLSMAFMLVNTNDGFSGVDTLRLPARGTAEYYLHAYDAGSEANTELTSDIPGPCCGNPGMGTATSDPISHHLGIQGVGDLDPATWGWEGPVAKLTVTRVD